MKQKQYIFFKYIIECFIYISICFLLFIFFLYKYSSFFSFNNLNYPNTYINGIDVSKMDYQEIEKILDEYIKSISSKNIFLSGNIILQFNLGDIVTFTNKKDILSNIINNKDLNILQRFVRYLIERSNNYYITYMYDMDKVSNIYNMMSMSGYTIDNKLFYENIQSNSGFLVYYNQNKDDIKNYSSGKIIFKDIHLVYIDNFIQKKAYVDFKVFDLITNNKIDYNKMYTYLSKITKNMNKEKVDGRIFINEKGKIIFDGNIKNGVDVDLYSLIKLIEYAQTSTASYVVVPTKKVYANIDIDENLQKRGIKKLLATGISDFSGSTSNRVHNIKVGASKYNGIIISSGAVFSFNKYLGSVDKKSGFVEGIVIKSGRNEKEYGGGLCQVSSTAYRMALLAGFDIIQRKNHHYMVQYYYPPGTDATIYPPSLDFKFLNNTNADILIQTFIEYPYVYFNVFGSDTGKKVYMIGPNVFGYIPPPPPQYFKTKEYPKGVTVQMDEAHPGLSSEWYRIIYQNGVKIKEERIFSKYVPWAAKFYTGI